MKIINRHKNYSSNGYDFIRSSEYIEFDNRSYKRTCLVDGKISWRFWGANEQISGNFVQKLENEYKICLREYKLKNILDENYI